SLRVQLYQSRNGRGLPVLEALRGGLSHRAHSTPLVYPCRSCGRIQRISSGALARGAQARPILLREDESDSDYDKSAVVSMLKALGKVLTQSANSKAKEEPMTIRPSFEERCQ